MSTTVVSLYVSETLRSSSETHIVKAGPTQRSNVYPVTPTLSWPWVNVRSTSCADTAVALLSTGAVSGGVPSNVCTIWTLEGSEMFPMMSLARTTKPKKVVLIRLATKKVVAGGVPVIVVTSMKIGQELAVQVQEAPTQRERVY